MLPRFGITTAVINSAVLLASTLLPALWEQGFCSLPIDDDRTSSLGQPQLKVATWANCAFMAE